MQSQSMLGESEIAHMPRHSEAMNLDQEVIEELKDEGPFQMTS